MTTMKRTVSWITALAMILMLCTCTVIAQAATIYGDSKQDDRTFYSYSLQLCSNSNTIGLGVWYIVTQKDYDDIPVDQLTATELREALNEKTCLDQYQGQWGPLYKIKDGDSNDINSKFDCGLSQVNYSTRIRFTVPAGLPSDNYVICNVRSSGDMAGSTELSTWTFTVYSHFNSNLVKVDTVADVIYGSNQAPAVTLIYKQGTVDETTMVQGTDFYISNYAVDGTVENNTAVYSGSGMPTVPGAYTATIYPSGLYVDDNTGSAITIKFNVLPKDVNTLPDNDVYMTYFDSTYTGSAIEPDVVVFDGQAKLVKGTDYTLSYENNVAAGTNTASVMVNGMGNYTGTKTLNFSIVKPTVVYQSSPTYVTAVAAPSNPTLKSGDKNNSVSTLQTRLNELGYNCGEVDGVFGAKTRAAVIAFQKANNLSVDGVAGPQTWAALGTGSYVYYTPVTVVSTPVYATASTASHSTLSRGKTGDEVKELQTLLNKMGYDCGLVDGVFGAKTEAAVRAFQSATNLAVDGIVGPLTWNKIDD